jgi:hypothetical protein
MIRHKPELSALRASSGFVRADLLPGFRLPSTLSERCDARTSHVGATKCFVTTAYARRTRSTCKVCPSTSITTAWPPTKLAFNVDRGAGPSLSEAQDGPRDRFSVHERQTQPVFRRPVGPNDFERSAHPRSRSRRSSSISMIRVCGTAPAPGAGFRVALASSSSSSARSSSPQMRLRSAATTGESAGSRGAGRGSAISGA